MDASRLVELGVITRPHGVRGELRVHRHNPQSNLLMELAAVWVLREGQSDPELRSVVRAKRSGGTDVLSLEACTSVELAEALRGAKLLVARDALPEAGAGEWYYVDLIGAAVHEGGVQFGVVERVASYPSVDALVIRTVRGEREIPMVEPYLVKVDTQTKVIEIAHSEDFEPEQA